jgi:predicted dinucleotide-binding enzyme/DMSO/TMAO reductase YedYZ heme-binding membrane subunit
MMIQQKETVAVIGTGNYGIALGKRLLDYGGFNVVFGSRSPDHYEYVTECLSNGDPDYTYSEGSVSVVSIKEAYSRAEKFVFLAIAPSDHVYQQFASQLNLNEAKSKKIIIEVSNSADESDQSNAERLAAIFKKHSNVQVVKGFNLINAFSLISNQTLDDKIPIAGNDQEAKELVINLCSKLGFSGVDVGPLKNARRLEQANRNTFEEWKLPFLNSAIFLVFNFGWIFLIYFYFPKKPHTFAQYLNEFSLLSHTNKVLGFSSLQILAFVYFGSIVASIYQLSYKTKYKRFPIYLDTWLKSRKQYGLIAFLLASFHVVTSLLVASPSYLADWYKKLEKPNKFNLTVMTLNGEINMLTGVLAYILMVLVALSSINSIANSLNWQEWRFVQTKLGLSCLVTALVHDIFMYARIFLEKDELNYDLVYLVTRVKLIAIYFPLLVVVLRFVFSYFPPISNRLENIRNGTIVARSKMQHSINSKKRN